MSKRYYEMPTTDPNYLFAYASSGGRAEEWWQEFCARYVPGIEKFLKAKWSNMDAFHEDIIQNVLIKLYKVMPRYHYTRGQKERFRNYLLTIVHTQACKMFNKEMRHNPAGIRLDDDKDGERKELAGLKRQDIEYLSAPSASDVLEADECQKLKEDLAIEARNQVLADETISAVKREAYRLLVCEHKSPEWVANRLGIKARNNVDQMKHVMNNEVKKRLKKLLGAIGMTEQDLGE